MVRLKGQLLSMDASGSLAKTLTFSSWKGRSYAKKFAVPTDNQQVTQLGIRAAMTFLSKQWSGLATADRDTWNEQASKQAISEFDAFIGFNLTRATENLAPTKAFPPVPATYTPSIFGPALTAHERFIQIEFALSPPPSGWSMAVYRDSTTGFTPSLANMVAQVQAIDLPAANDIRDTPPNPDTWFYRLQAGDDDGNSFLGAVEASIVWP